jgi:hypothetical protein
MTNLTPGGGAELSDATDQAVGVHDERRGIMLTREQLEEWVDGPITDEMVDRLHAALPMSSVPWAIQTIVWDALGYRPPEEVQP